MNPAIVSLVQLQIVWICFSKQSDKTPERCTNQLLSQTGEEEEDNNQAVADVPRIPDLRKRTHGRSNASMCQIKALTSRLTSGEQLQSQVLRNALADELQMLQNAENTRLRVRPGRVNAVNSWALRRQ